MLAIALAFAKSGNAQQLKCVQACNAPVRALTLESHITVAHDSTVAISTAAVVFDCFNRSQLLQREPSMYVIRGLTSTDRVVLVAQNPDGSTERIEYPTGVPQVRFALLDGAKVFVYLTQVEAATAAR